MLRSRKRAPVILAMLGGACLALCVWASCTRTRAPLLHTVQEVHACTPSLLQQGQAVLLKGSLVRYDERQRMLVLQDETGGIPVQLKAAIPGLEPGEQLAIRGYTAYESFNAVVVKPRVERLGRRLLPAAVPADPQKLFRGQQDFRRIELEGEILEARSAGASYFEMDVRAWDQVVRVTGDYLHDTPFYSLRGRRVRLRGIPVTTYLPNGEAHSLVISLHNDEDVSFTGPSLSTQTSRVERADLKLPRLTTLGGVKSLTNREAQKRYPISVQGTVLEYDTKRIFLCVQDGTGASFIYVPEPLPMVLKRGDRVSIEGHSASGAFAPVVWVEHLQVLGTATMPEPLKVRPSAGFKGIEENRWAEVEGIVRQVLSNKAGEYGLLVACGQAHLEVSFQQVSSPAALEALVDHQIRVRGVYATLWTADQRYLGTEIRAQDLSSVEELPEGLGETFDAVPRPIHSLLEYSPEGIPRHRIKVAGRVTHVDESGSLFVSDASGGIRVECAKASDLKTGDSVEVLGFLDWSRAKTSVVSAVIRTCADLPEVVSLPMAVDAVASGVNDGRLVQVEGFLREQATSFGDRILTLESGRITFSAILEHPQAFKGEDQLRPGALVRLTGVCDVDWNEDVTPPTPRELHLRLRSPQDIVVMKGGPFWTLGRAMGFMAVLLVGLVFAHLVLVVLQRRIRRKTEALKREISERELLEDQLRQAQKLEGVGRLAGGVAHDFNNLLTVINGYCEMLVGELEGQGDLQTCAIEIRKAGDRAASLTRQLLAFSRKQVLQPVVVDLNQLVADMEKMLGRLLTEDIRLVMRLSEEPCFIKVDPGQISQVMVNLAVNARDAMPQGGQLILETDPVVLDEDVSRSRPFVQSGPYIRLTVTDTGIGMDEGTLDKVFEPFFTTKEQGKGTGLGLSTVFGIVKQSGGHIWVYSEPGQGTSFKLFFPQIEGSNSEDEALPEEKTLGGGETVLVVEDQEEVRRLVCRALESQGYHVLSASDGPEALEVVRRFPGTLHLLVTDVVMPGMNGRDLARRMTELRKGVRVLFMSGYTEDAVVHRGVLEQGIDFIQKPFSPRELAATVGEILRRK